MTTLRILAAALAMAVPLALLFMAALFAGLLRAAR